MRHLTCGMFHKLHLLPELSWIDELRNASRFPGWLVMLFAYLNEAFIIQKDSLTLYMKLEGIISGWPPCA
jgi:hypothetical protein